MAKKSKPIELLDLIYENTNRATTHSWERLNHAMRAALTLAVGSGLEFALGDLAHIGSSYKSGYWLGDSDELVYNEAILNGNMTAIKSFEAWKAREPFIADGVRPAECYGTFVHGSSDRQRERLHKGASFNWKGHRVTVTSFAEDQKSLTACSYKPDKDGFRTEKVAKRFKITRDDILADRKARTETT